MPLYEYTCQTCQRDVELLIRGAETPRCPECDSTELEKRLSVTAAPAVTSGSLPMAGMCGRQQCAQGGCQGLG